MPPDPDLAAAGRAGLMSLYQDDMERVAMECIALLGDESCESVAQAVLDALGVRLDSWEWRATGEVRGFPFGSPGAVEDFARAWAEKSGGTVQRRRKVTTEWETVE